MKCLKCGQNQESGSCVCANSNGLKIRDAQIWVLKGKEMERLGYMGKALKCYERATELNVRVGSSLYFKTLLNVQMELSRADSIS